MGKMKKIVGKLRDIVLFGKLQKPADFPGNEKKVEVAKSSS